MKTPKTIVIYASESDRLTNTDGIRVTVKTWKPGKR